MVLTRLNLLDLLEQERARISEVRNIQSSESKRSSQHTDNPRITQQTEHTENHQGTPPGKVDKIFICVQYIYYF